MFEMLIELCNQDGITVLIDSDLVDTTDKEKELENDDE